LRILAYRTELQKDGVFLERFPNDDVDVPVMGQIINNGLIALEYLLDIGLPEEQGDTLRVFWDMDASLAPIFRLLNVEILKQLQKEKRAAVGKFSLFYMPEKVFTIRSGKNASSYYNLRQYALKEDDDLSGGVIETYYYAKMVYTAFKTLGMTPTKLSSPVAVFTDCFLDHMDLPSIKNG